MPVWVEHLTPDFSSGHDLRVVGLSPTVGRKFRLQQEQVERRLRRPGWAVPEATVLVPPAPSTHRAELLLQLPGSPQFSRTARPVGGGAGSGEAGAAQAALGGGSGPQQAGERVYLQAGEAEEGEGPGEAEGEREALGGDRGRQGEKLRRGAGWAVVGGGGGG